jgi:DNA repair exonuclease SbcCD nuclease subunit
MLIDHLANNDAGIIVFNGDLLDSAHPTLAEIKELSQAFKKLAHKPVYLMSGNHEAVSRTESTYDYIDFYNVTPIKRTMLNLEGVDILLCDWHNIGTLKLSSADILISHYRSAMPGLYDEEVDTSEFANNYKLILLGDLHHRYSPLHHAHYTSSPYSIHFNKAPKDYGYINLTVSNGGYVWEYETLNLPNRRRLDVEYDDLATLGLNTSDLYSIHVTGTLEQLITLEDTPSIEYTKIPTISHAPASTTSLSDVPFIDALIEKVEAQMSDTSGLSRSIILELQGRI